MKTLTPSSPFTFESLGIQESRASGTVETSNQYQYTLRVFRKNLQVRFLKKLQVTSSYMKIIINRWVRVGYWSFIGISKSVLTFFLYFWRTLRYVHEFCKSSVNVTYNHNIALDHWKSKVQYKVREIISKKIIVRTTRHFFTVY